MDENKDVNLDTMSFERFSMWTVNSLKKYLRICLKSTEWGVGSGGGGRVLMIWLQGRNCVISYFVETFVL